LKKRQKEAAAARLKRYHEKVANPISGGLIKRMGRPWGA